MMAGFSSSWADLPWELLQQILGNLPIPDNLRLVSCLSTWWANFKEQPAHSTVQTPWLLIHPHPDTENQNIATFYDVSRGEVLRIPVPLPPFQERICLGSTGGWMVTIARGTLEAHLLNPVSGRQIVLPKFGYVSPVEMNEDLKKQMDDYFTKIVVDDIDEFFRYSKAVVSWDKRKENGEVAFTVMIKLHCRVCIVVAREGQPDWQILQPRRYYEDVMTNAKGKIFLLDPIERWVDIHNLQLQDSQSSLEHISLKMPQDQESNLHFTYLAGWFLAEEPEIFILGKKMPPIFRSDRELMIRDPLFKVFKYDYNVGHFKEVNDLGGKSIFVGASNAMVLSLPGLRRNSVYYFDAFTYPNEVCIYYMEEHSFLRTAFGGPSGDVQRFDPRWLNAVGIDALWLIPSFE